MIVGVSSERGRPCGQAAAETAVVRGKRPGEKNPKSFVKKSLMIVKGCDVRAIVGGGRCGTVVKDLVLPRTRSG